MDIPTNVFVFNQYYLDLLKKVKNSAKKYKDKSQIAKNVMKSIKTNYTTFEKNTKDYINFIKEIPSEFFINLVDINEEYDEYFKENKDNLLYIDISILNIAKLLKDNNVFVNYLLILYLFQDDTLTDQETKDIVNKLKGIDDDIKITDEFRKKLISKIIDLNIKKTAGFSMSEIEDTSIGKLAKDIVSDLNLDKIKENVKNEGDVFKALGDKENGIGSILTDVSSKMADKLSNGSIKQEELVNDALKFASKMPQFGSGGGGSPDLNSMMKMMSSMMGGMGGMGSGGGGRPNVSKMKSEMKKMKKKNDLNEKLKKKQQED
jgi:hypothetical protein